MAIQIYGSRQCPDTIACLAALDEKGTDYVFADLSDLSALKAFLAIRDASPLYEPVKQAGGVGIPLLQREDGSLTLDWESEIEPRL